MSTWNLNFSMWRRFFDARGGNIMVVAAIAAPALLGCSALTLDFISGISAKQNLQNAADGAALAAAAELPLRSTNNSTVSSIVQSYVASNVGDADIVSIESSILDRRGGVRVEITARVPSMFGQMFNPSGTMPRAEAVARLAGGAPLCALALEQRQANAISLSRQARILAPDCAIASNSRNARGIVAQDNTNLRATMICSAGGAVGRTSNFSPQPITDCPAIPDPLAGREEPSARGCTRALTVSVSGEQRLSPGVYCGGISVLPGATARLSPGVYVMKNGPLMVMNGGALIGENVGFYFVGDLSNMTLMADSRIDLTAPRDGPMAGFLFFANRVLLTGDLNLRRFTINSNNARTLLGTIYLRDGILDVASQQPVADRSAYTVIVARRIEVSAGPDLVLNTDYEGSDVPVPDGVGPQRPHAFLAD